MTSNLQERLDELAASLTAHQQAERLLALAKEARLDRNRDEREAAWTALSETCLARMKALAVAPAPKRPRKPRVVVPATGQPITPAETEAKAS